MKSATRNSGFTLLEMTVVIAVMLTLIGVGLGVSSQYKNWQLGRTASEDLRSVYAAQRLYLSDNPTALVSSLTDAKLIPYLANRATAIPTVKCLDGVTRTIRVTVSPPNISSGGTAVYDPSGSTTDSLWDVGE
ncbi:MAG: type II secretion system protein [Luteolibacter sp.]